MKKLLESVFLNYDEDHSFLLFCLIFLLSSPIFAERLPVKIYTSADGLGSGFINSIASDSRGFMWFATRDGLSRFDGASFVTYQIGDKKTQPGIEQIYETKSGIYWITTTGGTYRFDPNKSPASDAAALKLNAELVEQNRGLFYEDSKGNLWSTANGLSLVKEKDGKVVFEKFELDVPSEFKSKTNVLEVAESIDGSMWMTVNTGLLRLLPNQHFVYYPYGENRTTGNSDFITDKKGYVWLASANNLFVLKPKPAAYYENASQMTIESFNSSSVIELKTGKPYQLPQKDGEIFQFSSNESNRFLERSFSKKLFKSSNETIWVSNENSLLEFNNGNFNLHTDKEGLPSVMTGLGEDSAGNLWVGGHAGLARIDLNGMISYGVDDGSISSRFFTINESKDGTLYFSGFEFYINQFKENRLVPVRPQIPLESVILWTSRSAFLDSNQNWWFATNDKLYHFTGISDFTELKTQQPKVYSTEDGLKSNAAYSIFEDSSGNIWVSTVTSNLQDISTSRLKKGENKFYTFTESEGLPAGKSFSSAVEDKNGNIWFTFYQGGVARFNGEKFDFWGNSEFLVGALLDIYLDKEERLWIASAADGLYRVRNLSAEQPEFVNLNTTDGLSSNNVRTVTGDNFGRIYLGSARGVDRLSPETGFVKHFSVNDGLAADFVVDSHRDQSGNLWFATNNGISKLIPLPEEKTSAPRILLGKLFIAGETHSIQQLGVTEVEKGELSANQNNLQIDFFGLDFRAGETLRYQYKLEGIDTDWKLPTEQRTVNFSNLSPGNYRFIVRAVNSEGQISENPAVVSFKILQPIYFRWWFITLAVLFVAGAVFALDRYRVHKTHQVEKALEETRKANVLIRESEIRFRTLADTASDAILTIDSDSKIIFVNEAIEKVFGYTPQELIGKPMTILMPERMRHGHNKGLSRYLQTNQKNINWEGVSLPGLHKDGHEIPLEVSFGEFEREGRRYFTGIARDVSERKRAEEALQKAREEKFKELQRVRTRIATDLHDDIGSSLTQIAVLTEVARGQASHIQAENLSVPLERIKGVSKELVSVMSDIVWAINPTKDNLPDLLQRMRRFGSDVFSGKGIKFEFYTPDIKENLNLGANIRRELFAIFKEAVNNSSKYAECTEAKVYFQIEDDWITLKIEDNGKGFDTEEILSENFRPEMGGNGLINIQRRAKDLGGACKIHSQIGKGTLIDLKIPLHLPETDI